MGMGATDFATTATATNADEAFAIAQGEARYTHGHGGYTGTIAEKPGFVVYPVPFDKLGELTVDSKWLTEPLNRLRNAINAYEYRDDEYIADTEWFRQGIADAEILARMGRKWESLVHLYFQKWESAVCVPLGNDEWGFLGLASC